MRINKDFLKNNKWTILVLFFFIVWKFFLINTLWNNNNYAHKDASIYIAHINSVIECPSLIFCNNSSFSFHSYTFYEHLTYRIFFGAIGKLFHLTAVETFHLSFYIGILMLIPVLIIFIKKIGFKKDSSIALVLFFLSLYNGAGSYHGFFWIVPSFFSLLLYLIILNVILSNNKNWKIWLFILPPLALYDHTLSLYLILSTILFYLSYSFLTKKIDKLMLKKIIFLTSITIIFYLPVSLYIGGNPYGAGALLDNSSINISKNLHSVNNIKKNIYTDHNFLPKVKLAGFNQIKIAYLNWIFPNIPALIAFIILILLCLYYKQYLLLAIYSSAFIFTMLSTININAVRFLIFLWPITYILYATGFLLSLRLIQEKITHKKLLFALKLSLFILLIMFSVFNFRFSYLYNKNAAVNFNDIIKI